MVAPSRPRVWLLAVVTVAALLRLRPDSLPGSSTNGGEPSAAAPGSADAVAFVGTPSAASLRARREAALASPRTAAAATATAQKVKGKGKTKYRGQVNPRLRSFLNSKEYRKLVSLLAKIKEEGQLENFLDRAEAYWREINVFELALKEQSSGGMGVLGQVKKDWPRIWPTELDGQRMLAFDTFQAFWGRLDRSKLVEDVMKTVLPDMDKSYAEQQDSKDVKTLQSLSDEERRDEVMKRMGDNEIVKQYAILSEYDQEVQSIGSQLAPFVAKFVSILERKVATQTESLGKTADFAIAGAVAVVLFIILCVAGVIKLPDPTWSDLKVG